MAIDKEEWRTRASRLRAAAFAGNYDSAEVDLKEFEQSLRNIPLGKDSGVFMTVGDLEEIREILALIQKLKRDLAAIRSYHRTFGKLPDQNLLDIKDLLGLP